MIATNVRTCDLVTKRFLAVFYPPAEFFETIRIIRVEGELFKSASARLGAFP